MLQPKTQILALVILTAVAVIAWPDEVHALAIAILAASWAALQSGPR